MTHTYFANGLRATNALRAASGLKAPVFVILSCLVFACVCFAQASAQTGRTQTSAAQVQSASAAAEPLKLAPVTDPHSYGNPQQVRVTHVFLDLTVDFAKRQLSGTATLNIERHPNPKNPEALAPLIVDTEKLKITQVEAASARGEFREVEHELGKADPVLGAPLTIHAPEKATRVRITYSTSPEASALQWLTPAQTVGKKHPYLFTQGEDIHTRSWIPLQDSPSVRVTYNATIHTPKDLVALMSAEGNAQLRGGKAGTANNGPGEYHFRMNTPIPSYLIALAVGDLAFRPIGERAGVYDEPSVVDRDAKELEDLEKMIDAAEKLYGPYRWGRYDVLILPPSFPFGGMENPRLTFASPTIIAGDKSLVSVICHELAHSWSGNLVTNATWSDFWLNEGVTTYIERRLVEAIYGKKVGDMEAVLGRQVLTRDVGRFDPKDQVLHVDLNGRDPDEGSTELPYEKGMLFLKQLELAAGREKFDQFLRGYFDHFAFHSITTQDFVDYLEEHLLRPNPEIAQKVDVHAWIYEPGVPKNVIEPQSEAFAQVEEAAKEFASGKITAAQLPKDWSSQEWLHFLKAMPRDLGRERMAALDQQFHFTQSGNIEITEEWLLLAIANGYAPADQKLEQVLTTVGRMKIIRPLYQALAKTPEGKQRAREIYKRARPSYHPILQKELDTLFST